MTAEPFGLSRAEPADIAFVMATERGEGYDAFVGRWDEARHRAALADPRFAYFVARRGGEKLGFAILRDWDGPERVTLVQRLAVTEPGQSTGRSMLAAILEAAFSQTRVHRVAIGLFPGNLRARRAYEAAGFVAEGVLRGNVYFGGAHRDELVMSVLRPEWQARRSPSPPSSCPLTGAGR